MRIQQILAYETDLLEYGDLFAGSDVIETKVSELAGEARALLAELAAEGGAVKAIESAFMKTRLVESASQRMQAIEAGRQTVIGVNAFTESEASPLVGDGDGGFMKPDAGAEQTQIDSLEAWRAARDEAAVARALEGLKVAAGAGESIMESSIAAAHAGVTTGEWAAALKAVFGEFRAPTGVVKARVPAGEVQRMTSLKGALAAFGEGCGRRPKILIGKPGLDGHSNGAEQIALWAREAGFAVIYDGIRLTPAELAARAKSESVDLIGLSVLSGTHVALVEAVLEALAAEGLEGLPVVAGGIIPPADAAHLRDLGLAGVYSPKDYEVTAILEDMLAIVKRGRREAA